MKASRGVLCAIMWNLKVHGLLFLDGVVAAGYLPTRACYRSSSSVCEGAVGDHYLARKKESIPRAYTTYYILFVKWT